jgi:hypothetical protein
MRIFSTIKKAMEDKLQVPVTRHWLESLSTEQLIKLADSYGIDIPLELERIFIVEEILEVSGIDNQETADDIEVNDDYSETAALPVQYNISYIDVIIRDPLWVFAFWEIKKHDRELHENADDFNGYCLRVIPLDKNGKEKNPNENPFTVSVDAQDCARYLGIVEHSTQDSDCYAVQLCVNRGDILIQIAVSQIFYLPKPYNNDIIAGLSSNPLIRLSGVGDLAIIKNMDHPSGVKRQ